MKKLPIKRKSVKKKASIRYDVGFSISPVDGTNKRNQKHCMNISVTSKKAEDLVFLLPWITEYIAQIPKMLKEGMKKHA